MGRDVDAQHLGELARRGSVVVSGDVGVGKSRLVGHVLERLGAAGSRTVLVRATRSTATVPFGPFAPWVPEDLGPGSRDRLQVLQAVSRTLLAAPGPVVVAVDDAHLLDEGSAALVLLLVTTGPTRVVATVRSGAPCPDAVVALWKEGLAELVELAPLGQSDTLSLAARALGGEVDEAARRRLWALTAGAPLYLREVLRAAVDQGVLAPSGGGGEWAWRGDLAGDARLRRLTNDNLDRSGDDARRALELVALGEPLPLALVADLGVTAELEDAQRRSLVAVDDDAEGRPVVRMAHPLYGEILRSELPRLVARVHYGALAVAALAAAAHVDGRAEVDPVRVASWCLESDSSAASPELYLGAARRALALGDWSLAERLGRAAEAAGAGAPATLLRAAALVQLGGWGGAEEVLARLDPSALDGEGEGDEGGDGGGDWLAEFVRFRAGDLVWRQGNFAAGRELLAGATTRLRGVARARVLTEAAHTAVFACEPATSLRLAQEALDAAGSAPVPRAQALAVATMAWTLSGRSRLALQAARVLAPLVVEVVAHDPYPGNPVSVIRPAHCMALVLEGRVAEAAAVADAGAHDPVEGLRVTARIVRARVALVEGRLELATTVALDALRGTGHGPGSHWPAATVLGAAAQRGAMGQARSFLGIPPAGDPQIPVWMHELAVARGWLAAAEGSVGDAADRVEAAAAVAAERGTGLLELLALLDLVRLGAPERATGPLLALADRIDGPLVGLAAAYATAAVGDGDGAALDGVSQRFETMGAVLVAAEAAADAAAAHRAAGDRTASRRSRARAMGLADRCEGARTPALRLGDADPALAALTRREREVMELAAQGLTNRAIAQRLFVSIRTVNAHLNHVYAKLEVSDRRELAAFVHRDQL